MALKLSKEESRLLETERKRLTVENAELNNAIEKMDRVSYAGLTKKNLSRGQWRFLDPKEIDFLKTR